MQWETAKKNRNCQTDCGAGCEYVIGLKGNQGTLHREVEESFVLRLPSFAGIAHTSHTSVEKGHGRLESREYWPVPDACITYLNGEDAGTCADWHGKNQRQLEGKTTEETTLVYQ